MTDGNAYDSSDGSAWAARAGDLAAWALARLANRTDAWGGQYADKGGATQRTTRKATDEVGAKGSGRRRGPLVADTLERHFREASTAALASRAVVGLHALGADSRGKWAAVDIDAHNPAADPGRNERFALSVYAEAAGLGFRPLLYDSDGKGGFHLWVLFAESLPGDLLFDFGRWLVRGSEAAGFEKVPETFPKQPALTATTPLGNWLRVVGRHHTRPVWPRVWDGTAWQAGAAAVAHVLGLDGDDPGNVPFEVLVESTAEPDPEPDPDGEGRQPTGRWELLPGDDFNRRGGAAEARSLLEAAGWTKAGTRPDGAEDWVRPGKDAGRGGTLGFCKTDDGRPLFYCFSASRDAAPLVERKAYTPFGLLAALAHGGDFSAARAAAEARGFGVRAHRPGAGGSPDGVSVPPAAAAAFRGPTAEVVVADCGWQAATAARHGVPCVGVDGPWGWLRPRANAVEPRAMVPALDGLGWAGRPVVLAFGSDAAEDDSAQWAAHSLAEVLAAKGALVTAVYVPPAADGGRAGVGDVLAAGGRAAWGRLRRAATPVPRPDPPGVLSNVYRWEGADGKEVAAGRHPDHVRRRLARLTGGWPKRVDGRLFVEDARHRPRWLDQPPELFAFAQSAAAGSGSAGSAVHWRDKATAAVTKAEFFAYLGQSAEAFDAVELFPHHVPFPRHYYMHPPVGGGDGRALAALLGELAPASPVDAELLLAFFATLFWGGPFGGRPVFLVEAEDAGPTAGRGAGKSTVLHLAARLLENRSVSIEDGDDIGGLKTRLLSPESAGVRLVLLDNLKSRRFSWGDLESLVTSPTVSGRRLYKGEGTQPNAFTIAVSVNGANLSKDFSQRTVVIRLKRAAYRAGWLKRVHDLVDGRRWDIIGDLLAFFDRPPRPLTKVGRWEFWESDVVARLANPDEVMAVVAARRDEMDADADEAELVREAVAAELSARGHDPETATVRFKPADIASLAGKALGKQMATESMCAHLGSLGVPGLSRGKSGAIRYWLWIGPRCTSSEAGWTEPVPTAASGTPAFWDR